MRELIRLEELKSNDWANMQPASVSVVTLHVVEDGGEVFEKQVDRRAYTNTTQSRKRFENDYPAQYAILEPLWGDKAMYDEDKLNKEL